VTLAIEGAGDRTAARAALGEDAFDAQFARGATMQPEDVRSFLGLRGQHHPPGKMSAV
jgi:hypothetical protein